MSLLLFDLDGTLYSSREILPRSYHRGIETFNRKQNKTVAVPSDDTIFDQVGKPAPEIYKNLFPDLSDDEQAYLQQEIFSALLEGIQRREGRLYPGVRETLESLVKKYDLGVVTNAQTEYMEAVLEAHDLRGFFNRTLCHDDASTGRKAELVAMQLESSGLSPELTRMIGDRESDWVAAREHDVPFIHCSYGYGTLDDYPDEDRIESLTELLQSDRLPEPHNTGPAASK